MIFNDVVGLFKGFFARSFWFGNFLPVALFATIHLLICWLAFPHLDLSLWFGDTASKALYFTASFAALIVLAYASTPLVPVIRGLFDGSLLPGFWHDALRRQHLMLARDVRRKINAAFDNFTEAARLSHSGTEDIWAARRAGDQIGAIGDEPAIPVAVDAVDRLVRQFDHGVVPDRAALEAARDVMIAALQRNAAKLPQAKALADAQVSLVQLLNDAEADALHQWQTMQARYRHVSYDWPQTTQMADTRFHVESYSFNAYGVNFDYIWPRLQLVLPQQAAQADGSFNDKLAAARAQIDFAILSLGLSLTIPAFWLPYLFFTATRPLPFAIVGAITPLLVGFFYYVALESQVAFGDVMKGAIDNYRFTLLSGTLRQTLPQTLAEERKLWSKLQVIDEPGTSDAIYYQHPKSS